MLKWSIATILTHNSVIAHTSTGRVSFILRYSRTVCFICFWSAIVYKVTLFSVFVFSFVPKRVKKSYTNLASTLVVCDWIVSPKCWIDCFYAIWVNCLYIYGKIDFIFGKNCILIIICVVCSRCLSSVLLVPLEFGMLQSSSKYNV